LLFTRGPMGTSIHTEPEKPSGQFLGLIVMSH
jgi:hypothetical protein